MTADIVRDPDLEWLDHAKPTGLVLSPTVIKERTLVPERQTQADTAQVAAFLGADDGLALPDPWAFAEHVLGWDARYVAGAPGGPPLPEDLAVAALEHETTLAPDWAVRGFDGDAPWQLLVRLEPVGTDPDRRGAAEGWEATPQQRFERLLRETGILAGVMLADQELRLVYAPRGETSGWVSLPLRSLATVAGRPMLAGLKLVLGGFRLFNAPAEQRLRALLKESREAQAAVSTALAEQILGALHELVRGFNAAEHELAQRLARDDPQHLYEGLLAVLMRLVFVLYAEDRDLIPSHTDADARKLYDDGYSVRGLYAKLSEDAALNPDTMEERYGAWGRLLALFRLIHRGHPSGFVQARGGKLFDPDAFPFLEGRADPSDPPRVAKITDGCLLRILEGLMTVREPRTKVRQRLSYRALDVEQIGSVYETVIGFTVQMTRGRVLAIRAGKNNRTPVFADLDELTALKPADRPKHLKEVCHRGALSAAVERAVRSAAEADAMAAAFDPIVDERGSPGRTPLGAGAPILQPTEERRRTGSHYTPRTLTEPIVRHALEPAFERLGEQATPEAILDLKVCDPAMDLPTRSVLIGGLDRWHAPRDSYTAIEEPALARYLENWLRERERLEQGRALRLLTPPLATGEWRGEPPGVDVTVFPTWFICERVETPSIGGQVRQGRRLVRWSELDPAGGRRRFVHDDGKKVDVSPLRFVGACEKGHLQDVDWRRLVHAGEPCHEPMWLMEEGTSASLGDLEITCSCGRSLSLRDATKPGRLSKCEGRQPWLSADAREPCLENLRLLTRSATNAYFPQVVNVISLPVEEDALLVIIRRHLADLSGAESPEDIRTARKFNSALRMDLDGYSDEEVYERLRQAKDQIGQEASTNPRPRVRRPGQRPPADRCQRSFCASLR